MENPMFLRNTLEQPVFVLRRNRMAMSIFDVGAVGTVGRPVDNFRTQFRERQRRDSAE